MITITPVKADTYQPAHDRVKRLPPCTVHIYSEIFAQVPDSYAMDAEGPARNRREPIGEFRMHVHFGPLSWRQLKPWLPPLLEAWVGRGGPDENRAEARRRIETALDHGPRATLDLSGLGLRELPALLPNVVALDVSNNRLITLTLLPCALEVLYASGNDLRHLPSLPSSLRELHVAGNSLTNLPSPLPDSLGTIDAARNALVDLPAAQAVLANLSVAENRGADLEALASQRLKEAAYLRSIRGPSTSLGLKESVSGLFSPSCPAKQLADGVEQVWRQRQERGR